MTIELQRSTSLPPYFHPTTFCIVDDNERFVRSLLLEMPSELVFQVFSNPEDALEFINTTVDQDALPSYFTIARDSDADIHIHFDMSQIEREIANPQRFRRLSVAMIDYAMPSMSGVDLIAQMRDPHTRRAMITGVADEKFAVELFNAGLIHRFIQKQKANDLQSLLAHIADMQREYFEQYLSRLRMTLSVAQPEFLRDPAITSVLKKFMADERLIEYYLVNGPAGLLLLRSNGSVVRLILLNEEDQAAELEFARRFNAPERIIKGFEAGLLIGFFEGDSPENYHGGEVFPWDDHVVPAKTLQAQQTWRMGVVRDPPMDIDFDPRHTCYDAYLASING